MRYAKNNIFIFHLFWVFSSSGPFTYGDILLPSCISEDNSWLLGCRCFAFFKAVFASESARSFSSIPWWAGQYTNLMFCTFGLISLRFLRIALTVLSYVWQLAAAPFFKNYVELYFDKKHLQKVLNMEWWNFWCSFFKKSAFFWQYWMLH